jgi:hypothetical protein
MSVVLLLTIVYSLCLVSDSCRMQHMTGQSDCPNCMCFTTLAVHSQGCFACCVYCSDILLLLVRACLIGVARSHYHLLSLSTTDAITTTATASALLPKVYAILSGQLLTKAALAYIRTTTLALLKCSLHYEPNQV